MTVQDGWFGTLGQPRVMIELASVEDAFAVLIDTGFTGHVLLPTAMTREHRIEFDGEVTYIFGNKQKVTGHFFFDLIRWFGAMREIRVDVFEDAEPSIGISLLLDCTLEVNWPGRTVRILGT